MTPIQIRSEEIADHLRIKEVTELAFRGAAHTCKREHLIAERLREAEVLTLSLVAMAGTEVVGYLAVSPVTVSVGTGEWFGFGPLAVLPQWQKQGIGSRLMETALSQLRVRGARGGVLVGDPAYYVRFGFRSDPALVVPGVPPEVSLCLRFSPCDDHGTATFHAAFMSVLTEP